MMADLYFHCDLPHMQQRAEVLSSESAASTFEAAATPMESSMHHPIKFHTRLISTLMAAVIGACLAIVLPAGATDSDAGQRSAAGVQLAQSCQMYGPYATIRRANEIAQEASGLGYSFQVFHNGDGYYVRVC